MKVKALIQEDFVNFKQCSMLIGFPTCSWKCGKGLCQNSDLAQSKSVEMSIEMLIALYIRNPISKAILCAGLEPLDSFPDLLKLVTLLREQDKESFVVIYTGYNKEEIKDKIAQLSRFKNIIVKFGRFVPDQEPHYDEVLGVELASDNQYAEVIS